MININLLPVREERRKAGLRQLGVMLGAAAVGAMVLCALLQWKMTSDLDSARQQVATTQRQIDQFGPQLKQVEEFRKTKTEIERKLEVIDRLDESRSGPVHVLDELASRTPERVWISKIAARDRTISIYGLSLDNELVALFLTQLNDSPYFKDVELLATQAKEVGGFKLNEFELTATLTSPASDKRAEKPVQTAAATTPPAGAR